MTILYGIRWIAGLPIGYYAYLGVIMLNDKLINFGIEYISNSTFWSIESLFIETFLAIYIGLTFAYFMLPKDQFALVNNTKVKVMYWAISLWSVLLLILLGSGFFEVFNGYDSGDIYLILNPLFSLLFVWLIFKGISLVDFNHNQPHRDSYDDFIQAQNEAATDTE